MGFWDGVQTGAEGWQPEPGSQLAGTVREVKMATSQYGDYPLIVISQPPDGDEIALHAFHARLVKQLKEQEVQVGMSVRIEYHGKGPDGKHNYSVSSSRDDIPF